MTIEGEVTVTNKRGMHLRFAGALMKVANAYKSEIMIYKGSNGVNAKSMLDLVSLSAAMGTVLKISANGSDAQEAFEGVKKFFLEYNSEA